MTSNNQYIVQAEVVAGSNAGSLRSPEAQSSYFLEMAKVEAITSNTRAIEDLTKTIDSIAKGILGEMMSLKEAVDNYNVPRKPTKRGAS